MSDNITQLGTTTPRLNLNLPDVGGDWDQWGDDTNANWQFIDANLLPIYGGAMTGTLLLNADPIQPLAASTKQYVDALRALYLPMAGGALEGQLVTAPIAGGGANVSLGIGGTANGLWSTSTALVLQAGGANNTTFGTAGNLMNVPLQIPGGSFAAPGLGLGAANTGIYSPSSSNVGIACSGVSVFATSSITARFLIPLQLAADPTTGLGAATKQYVDGLVGGAGVTSFNGRNGAITLTAADVATASALTIPGDGTLQIGTSNAQMPGPLTVGGQGINFLAMGAIGANMAIGYQANQVFVFANGAATQPIAMQAWVTSGFLGLGGGTLTGPLLQAADPAVPLATATKQYVDAGVAAGAVASANNRGRNLVHNPMFNIRQRSGTPYTTDGYTLDRWKVQHSGSDTFSISQAALTDADRAAIGDEAFTYALQNTFVGSAVAGSAHFTTHNIEDVRRLAGKTVAISFWARCTSGSLTLRGLLYQNFGTGGSPSAGVQVGTHDYTITTAWQRFTAWSIAVPSVAGKTLGTNNDSNTALIFYYSAQGAFVQSGTIEQTGVQLEIGSVATAFDKPEYEADIRNCERFYQLLAMYLGAFTTGVSQAVGAGANFRTQMRGSPTLAVSFNGSSNVNLGAPGLQGSSGIFMAASSSAAGNVGLNLIIACDSDL